MTDFEMVENIAKSYFNGDEEKAAKFLMAYRKAEGDGVIDNVVGSVESIININETVKNIGYVITHPNETMENIKLSAKEWDNLLGYAMKNDPALAGEMLGYIKGSATTTPGADLVLGGAIAKTAQKVIKLAKQSGAAFTNKIDDVANLGVNNPKYDKALNEKITDKGNVATAEKKAQTDTALVCNGVACFVAGTLVETARGLIPIEQIGFGDLIWSREEFGNHYAYKPVVATKATDNQQLVEIIVENEQGQQETYLTTTEHPFYVESIGWLKATLLASEMKLLDRNGSASLKVVSQNMLDRYATVYNIMVDDHHTYHIGELGVWVHNANCCDVTRSVLEEAYGKLNNGYFGSKGEIYWRNPLTNKVEQINDVQIKDGKSVIKNPLTNEFEDATKVKIAVDHILPKNYFKQDSRFKKLPKAVQEALMNSPENLQPMLASANSSKRSIVELNGKGWDTWKGKKVDSQYKDYLFEIQNKMNQKLEAAYKQYGIK